MVIVFLELYIFVIYTIKMKHTFLIAFFLLTSNYLFSQKTKLSQEDYLALEGKARTLISSNIDSSFIVATQIEKSDDFLHKAVAYGIKSYVYQLKGDTINSNKNLKKAFVFLDKKNDSNEKIRVKSILALYTGLIDWKRDKINDALQEYNQSRLLAEKIGDYNQIIKANRNSAVIYGQIGNFKSAISTFKKIDKLINNIQYKITEEELFSNKSILYYNWGGAYYKMYNADNSKIKILDSAIFYYEKSINFSKNLVDNRLGAQNNIATIYFIKKEYIKAKKIYFDILSYCKENGHKDTYYNTMYNLGELHFTTKEYDKAEICFKKVDSIYEQNPITELEYIMSNYYQAKLYDVKKNPEKAVYHSKIYLTKREEYESKLKLNKLEINSDKEGLLLKKDMNEIQIKYKNSLLYEKIMYGFILVAFLILVVYLIKMIRDKRKIDLKVEQLVKEYSSQNKTEEINLDKNLKKTISISIDDEKEEEIVKKLIALESKQFYLTPDFNQQTVAKKIKTNTTYLSYVVNKRFGKSFSEYSNELKINYIIKELVNNSTYRKYSTQALAESVGFKNAISFSKSFNKRTGVSPVQFIKRLDRNL